MTIRPSIFRRLSPRSWRKRDIVGHVDAFDKLGVIGWAASRRNVDEHLSISIWAGDDLIGSGIADLPRPDLAQAGFGRGDHAFRVYADWNKLRSADDVVVVAEVRSSRVSIDRRSRDSAPIPSSDQAKTALVALVAPEAFARAPDIAALLRAVEKGDRSTLEVWMHRGSALDAFSFLSTPLFGTVIVARERAKR